MMPDVSTLDHSSLKVALPPAMHCLLEVDALSELDSWLAPPFARTSLLRCLSVFTDSVPVDQVRTVTGEPCDYRVILAQLLLQL